MKVLGRDEPFAWYAIAEGRKRGLCCATTPPVTHDGRRLICTRDHEHLPPHKAITATGITLAAWVDIPLTR